MQLNAELNAAVGVRANIQRDLIHDVILTEFNEIVGGGRQRKHAKNKI